MMLFLILAALSVFSAVMVITRKNPVNSALFLIMNFIVLAGIYLTLHAQFVAIMQIVVYAGAIMVLVIFVIMLLNLQNERDLSEPFGMRMYVNIAIAVLVLTLVIEAIGVPGASSMVQQSPSAAGIGTVEHIGSILYTRFLYPFELTSILLLAAMIGAILLAKRRLP